MIFTIIMCMLTCITFSQERNTKVRDRIKDLPKKINVVYVINIISDENTAIEYAKIILKKRYPNVSFEKLEPFEITSIAEGKVWEVKIPTDPQLRGIAHYHIRINKNTGEILNFWVDK